jgi:hypothetical protein
MIINILTEEQAPRAALACAGPALWLRRQPAAHAAPRGRRAAATAATIPIRRLIHEVILIKFLLLTPLIVFLFTGSAAPTLPHPCRGCTPGALLTPAAPRGASASAFLAALRPRQLILSRTIVALPSSHMAARVPQGVPPIALRRCRHRRHDSSRGPVADAAGVPPARLLLLLLLLIIVGGKCW